MRLCRPTLFGSLLSLSLALVSGPGTARAQVLPGGRGSSAGQMQSGYATYVRREVDAAIARLEAALNARDAKKVSEVYDQDVHLLTASGALVMGRGAVRDRFERALPRMRSVQIAVQSFVNSGDMAYVLGILRYDVALSTGGAKHIEGPVSLVFRQERYSWVIQSQSGGELPATIVAHDQLPARAAPGDTLRLSVRVTDASGQNLANVLVAFEEDAGGAVVRPVAVMTNAAGIATTTVTLGGEPGLNVIRATASGIVGESVFFSIRAIGSDSANGGTP